MERKTTNEYIDIMAKKERQVREVVGVNIDKLNIRQFDFVEWIDRPSVTGATRTLSGNHYIQRAVPISLQIDKERETGNWMLVKVKPQLVIIKS